jgi:hypothetical protein
MYGFRVKRIFFKAGVDLTAAVTEISPPRSEIQRATDFPFSP